MLVTGVNGIRKTTSVHQPWFADVLREALVPPPSSMEDDDDARSFAPGGGICRTAGTRSSGSSIT